MKETFSLRVNETTSHRPNQATPGQYIVELTIDEKELVRLLGHRAIRSKGGKAKTMQGAVQIKVISRPSIGATPAPG